MLWEWSLWAWVYQLSGVESERESLWDGLWLHFLVPFLSWPPSPLSSWPLLCLFKIPPFLCSLLGRKDVDKSHRPSLELNGLLIFWETLVVKEIYRRNTIFNQKEWWHFSMKTHLGGRDLYMHLDLRNTIVTTAFLLLGVRLILWLQTKTYSPQRNTFWMFSWTMKTESIWIHDSVMVLLVL